MREADSIKSTAMVLANLDVSTSLGALAMERVRDSYIATHNVPPNDVKTTVLVCTNKSTTIVYTVGPHYNRLCTLEVD